MRAAVVILLATGAMFVVTGCAGAGAVSLRSAEAAFAHNHVAFESDWQSTPKNPFLSASSSGFINTLLSERLRARLKAIAAWESPFTYKQRLLFVFDSAAVAARFASSVNRHASYSGVVLVSGNLAYLGEDLPGVRAAMSSLQH